MTWMLIYNLVILNSTLGEKIYFKRLRYNIKIAECMGFLWFFKNFEYLGQTYLKGIGILKRTYTKFSY